MDTKVFKDWSDIGVVMTQDQISHLGGKFLVVGNNDKCHSRTTMQILVFALSE